MAAKRNKFTPLPVRRTVHEVLVHKVRDDQDGGCEVWELLHPRCSIERADDIEEVETMLSMGEAEIAIEELRYLLADCSDFIKAHSLLGEAALSEGDLALARGHFGHAYNVGLKALQKVGMPTPVPYRREANQKFFEAGKGLVHCLKQLEKLEMASDVVGVLIACDPSDPLGIGKLLEGS